MLEQLQFGSDGRIRTKVETAVKRLQTFEPPEGYYVAFSGGKDSQCVYHLCKMASVKFDAHYAVTSVDPPELVWFIKHNYPDVHFERQYWNDSKPEHHYSSGRPKPITMWNLIEDHTLPPTRKVRYCCSALKETGGQGRVVVTGVRWAESSNRKNTHDVVDIRGKKAKKKADALGSEYRLNKHGDVILNDDNDENRRMVEQCYRTHKTMVNPIVDWTDDDVWGFLNGNGIPHCSLYDEGFTRLGCIGCPLSGSKNMIRDFERWPKYKELYIRAFQRMIDNHPGQIKILDPNADTKWKLLENAAEKLGGGCEESTSIPPQTLTDGTCLNDAENSNGGGYAGFRIGSSSAKPYNGGAEMASMVDSGKMKSCSDSSCKTAMPDSVSTPPHRKNGNLRKPCSFDGRRFPCAEYVFSHWLEMGAT